MAKSAKRGGARPSARSASAGAARAKSKAKAKPRPARKKAAVGRQAVRVRMYRQGLGDCFLLTFPRTKGKGDYHVLIDCGVILGTPDAKTLMQEVVKDLAEVTGKKVDVLVATHEHWDHVSGFDQAKELFEQFEFGQVWLAWTEDPHNQTARQLRQERAHKLAALWMGVGQLRQRFGADADPETRDTIERAAQVLSFFGIDPDEAPPTAFGAAAAAVEGGKTGAAMRWVRERTKDPKFWSPGDVIPLEEVGVRVFVLGPPTDTALLFKDLPTKSGQETYDEGKAKANLAAAERAYFAAAFGADDPGVRPDFVPALPFDEKYQIGEDRAKQMDFFRQHYFGSGDNEPDAWRRADAAWTAEAGEFALQLDSDTNNTSLALAFELPSGQVLLFPGDAQVGNWESWHKDGDKTRVWTVGGQHITAEMLLNRTVLYKVGHHGSHNATLRAQGLEMMTSPELAALVPVDVYIAHEKKKWVRMPFDPLMHRLSELTRGRVVQAGACRASGSAG